MVGSSGQPASNVSSTIPRTTRATGPAGSVFNTLDFNKSDLLGADQSDDRTSATTLRQMNRFRKFGACNYQNVDLFKISLAEFGVCSFSWFKLPWFGDFLVVHFNFFLSWDAPVNKTIVLFFTLFNGGGSLSFSVVAFLYLPSANLGFANSKCVQ